MVHCAKVRESHVRIHHSFIADSGHNTAFLTLRKLDAEVRYGRRSLMCEPGLSIHLAVFVSQFELVVTREP